MHNFIKVGRAFYGVSIVAFGIQQILVKDFRPQIVPAFPAWAHSYAFLPIITGAALVLTGIIITGLFTIKAISTRDVCLWLGCYFLSLILFAQLPYTLVMSQNKAVDLGVWVDTLKELAYCGGAFVIAGSFRQKSTARFTGNTATSLLKKLIPTGRIFFSITTILFGYSHFLYTDFVAPLVPTWFGMAHFWTLFAGVALIGSGIAIMLKIVLQPAAYLLSIMLILWVILLHLPRAIADPYSGNGNEVVSAFDALLFCGVALVIGSCAAPKPSASYATV